ncbi:cysteine desulfurase DndA [Pseudoalteromonas translucida]|uniref:cysteine desulfurase n=1 Tax=Pseudoalteromonas translucida (strain TAC 125) TaxID=326442 RepID=Q3ICV6_PSET1|nr:cysteine desulfurase DndA [Pseudoalteromonas translucida]CAI89148.1 Cysteine desulfurase (ThiI) (transpersulfidase) (NifS protein homolog) [Pseudoalteromonas translucida]
MTTYLDMNATAPVLKEVADLVRKMFLDEYGNAGSRTHEFGTNAKKSVEKARKQVAEVVDADKSEVIFTSGATESNNIAILGLREFGEQESKKHIITTRIEHKAVLEPIEYLFKNGFEVSFLEVDESGVVDSAELKNLLRKDTLLVSIMHVNNETGSIQPIIDICDVLELHEAFLHIDAAQSFGKLSDDLKCKRIDLISVSGHKVYAPKGVGALVMRKRGFMKPPLKPIMFGGGQEKGLRPGTLAVPLIAGFGLACEIAQKNSTAWQKHAQSLKDDLIAALNTLDAQYNGENTSPFVLNFSVPGINSEAAMVMLKGIAAVSNGSACTSSSYTPSHVLTAMQLDEKRIAGAIRVSWGHMTESLPITEIIEKLEQLKL